MKPILLISIALACGLVAAVGAARYMGDNRTAVEAPTVKIVVAKREMNINEELNDEKLELVDWPQNRLPMGVISDPKKLANTHARTRLYPGEPILLNKVAGTGENVGSLKVPLGYRVVSVRVNIESSVSNLIQPGDRVDLVVVIKSNQRSLSKTILRAVRVFAVNSETTRSAEPNNTPQEIRTASLLVTPDQAEKLLMGAELGQLRLALRSPDDANVDETAGCSYERLMGYGEVADNTLGKAAKEAPPVAEQPQWTMLVCSPRNVSKFNWPLTAGPPDRADLGVPSTAADQPAETEESNPPKQPEQKEAKTPAVAAATP